MTIYRELKASPLPDLFPASDLASGDLSRVEMAVGELAGGGLAAAGLDWAAGEVENVGLERFGDLLLDGLGLSSGR